MSQQEKSAPRYARRNPEEDRAWFHLYRRVGEPAVAHEVVQHLESDAEMKRTHLALYLRCKETLRIEKARQTRNQRIGQFVRMAATALFVAPFRAVRSLLRSGAEVAVEILPETRKEPAVRHVQRIRKSPEFAQANAAFEGPANPAATGSEVPASPSRDAKAA